jgi:hypothetical protein
MDPPIDDFGSLIADGNAEGAERPADKPTNSLLRALQLSNYYVPLRVPTDEEIAPIRADWRAECKFFDQGNPAYAVATGARKPPAERSGTSQKR